MDKETQEIIKIVEKTIERTVNGKIDRLDKKVQKHLDEIQPFLDGWHGAHMLGRLIKWVAGLVIAVAGAIAILMSISNG